MTPEGHSPLGVTAPDSSVDRGSRLASTFRLPRVPSVASSSGAPTITTSSEFSDINNNTALPITTVRQASRGKAAGLYDVDQPTTSALSRCFEWKGHMLKYAGRYSIDKLLAFEEYQGVVSPLRMAMVLVLAPLPSVAVVVVLAAIPLNSPLLSVEKNAAYVVQSFLAHFAMLFGLLLFVRCSLGWSPKTYSHPESVVVAVLTAACNEVIMFGIATWWRFPVPLDSLVRIPTCVVLLILFHALVLGSRLRRCHRQLCRYFPLLLAEFSVLIMFVVLAILFMNVSSDVQVALAVSFPVLFLLLKRVLWSVSHSLEDMSTDVTLCVVVISGAILRMACLQSAHELHVGVVLVALDVIHGLLETWLLLHHRFVVDGQQTTRTAFKIVESALYPGAVSAVDAANAAKLRPRCFSFMGDTLKGSSVSVERMERQLKSTKQRDSQSPWRKHSSAFSKRLSASVVVDDEPFSQVNVATAPISEIYAAPSACIDDINISHREQAKVLVQTLQLLYASEMLLFNEYFAVAGAVVYNIYSLALYHMPYARYSLTFSDVSPSELWGSVGSSTIYAVLKLLSLFVLCELVRSKYGLSTLYQLAFVLEKYWMSIQGKLLSTLLFTFIMNTVHHGIDSSLEFDWEKLVNGSQIDDS